MSLYIFLTILAVVNALLSVLNLWVFFRNNDKVCLVISILCFGAMIADIVNLVAHWNSYD